MKIKFILLVVIQFIYATGFSQYIGVKARYTETKLVDDSPNPPKRENRLILSFYYVSPAGVYTPANLSNFDIWVYKEGFQYGNYMGGVLDSIGNNYPGFGWPAPKVVAYNNTVGLNYIDCDPNAATHYIVNGHELDCGFVIVSFWDVDNGTGQSFESFPAPNVCLPYYTWPHPYANSPGNVNFNWPVPPGPPYNLYSYACFNSIQQQVIRGVLPLDSSVMPISLPITLANVKVTNRTSSVIISWSNLTESNLTYYEVEKSKDGISFHSIAKVFPKLNNSCQADYDFTDNDSNLEKKLFYRIKVVENNGNYLYSSIVSTSYLTLQTSSLSIYPNPVINGRVRFQLTNVSKGSYCASLINAFGQVKFITNIQHAGGTLTKTLELFNAPTGMYCFTIMSDDMMFSKKVMINNK